MPSLAFPIGSERSGLRYDGQRIARSCELLEQGHSVVAILFKRLKIHLAYNYRAVALNYAQHASQCHGLMSFDVHLDQVDALRHLL